MRHFPGTITKQTADGRIVQSTYLDEGEELVVSAPTSTEKTVETVSPDSEEHFTGYESVEFKRGSQPKAQDNEAPELTSGLRGSESEGSNDGNEDNAPAIAASESEGGGDASVQKSGNPENPDTSGENAAPAGADDNAGGDGSGEDAGTQGSSEEEAAKPTDEWTHDQLNDYAGKLTPPLTLSGSSPTKAEKVELINEHVKANS